MADLSKIKLNGTTYNLKDATARTDIEDCMKKGIDYVTAGKKVGTTLGTGATTEGYDVIANGDYSHAEGRNTTASGNYSHAEGSRYGDEENGWLVKISGNGNNLTYNYDFSDYDGIDFIGVGYLLYKRYDDGAEIAAYVLEVDGPPASTVKVSNSLGNLSTTTEFIVYDTYNYDSLFGPKALGRGSHAEGEGTIADGNYTHAEGVNTVATKVSSHAEGCLTVSSGSFSHTEGYSTRAFGSASHAEGFGTKAEGSYAHTEGYQTQATGSYGSHAEGYYTQANKNSQHVFGEFNIADTGVVTRHSITGYGTYVEIVGNGTSTSDRHNARTLDWNGNEILAGKLTVGVAPTNNMDVATKQYVDEFIEPEDDEDVEDMLDGFDLDYTTAVSASPNLWQGGSF